MIDQLLRLKRQAPSIPTKWVFITIIITLFLYGWKQQFLSGWVLIPFLICVATCKHYINTKSRAQRLQTIEDINIPAVCLQRFRQQYPQLGLKQQRLIEQGFKDYLSVHALHKQSYAMPSVAVDMLWHVMLDFPEQYQQFCQQTLGRQLNHHPYTASTMQDNNPETEKQLLEAWRLSCQLHGLNPSQTTQLSRLFAIDQALNWPQGQIFELSKISADYKKYLKDQSSSSSCGGSSCSSCGGD